jgi:nitrate/nitrite-specific signal transduction histidine kinase
VQVNHATIVPSFLAEARAAIDNTISDDGRGFDPAAVPAQGHYGLRGLHERVRLLNGTVTIEATPGQGTIVQVAVPLTDEPQRAQRTRRK